MTGITTPTDEISFLGDGNAHMGFQMEFHGDLGEGELEEIGVFGWGQGQEAWVVFVTQNEDVGGFGIFVGQE